MNKVSFLGNRSTRSTIDMCRDVSVSCDPTPDTTVSSLIASARYWSGMRMYVVITDLIPDGASLIQIGQAAKLLSEVLI